MSNFNEALSRIKHIAETLPDDDPDKVEMINIEGDYSKLMDWALSKRAEQVVFADACKVLQSKYKDRETMFKRKADGMKDVVRLIMSCAGERAYKSQAGTVSVKNVAPKPVVTDESLVPDEYKKTTVTIDKTAINKAVKLGDEIEGVTMDNGGETIAIRC